MQRITGSTADAVIQALYPKASDLLKRFELVKKTANVADAERDRLRKYIQEKIPPGQHDNVILTMTDTAEQVYVNADGKYVLKYNTLIDHEPPESGITVAILAVNVDNAIQLVDEFLHALQKSKENLVAYVEERFIGSGLTIDNALLYTEKGGTKMDITVLPEPASGGANGPSTAD